MADSSELGNVMPGPMLCCFRGFGEARGESRWGRNSLEPPNHRVSLRPQQSAKGPLRKTGPATATVIPPGGTALLASEAEPTQLQSPELQRRADRYRWLGPPHLSTPGLWIQGPAPAAQAAQADQHGMGKGLLAIFAGPVLALVSGASEGWEAGMWPQRPSGPVLAGSNPPAKCTRGLDRG